MGPDWLVGGEQSETVNAEGSGTGALAEGSALATFFSLAIFLALRAEGHLLEIVEGGVEYN